MAIPVNIDDLINRRIVESNRVEFKSDFNPNAVIHTICAFANDIDNIGGGYIVVGVEEHNGSPVFPIKGIEQDRIDGILQELVGYCRMIEPFYAPIAEPVLFEGVYCIVIWVSGGYGRPYKAPFDVYGKEAKKSAKYYYIRKFSSTVVASPEEEKELFYISADIPFDDRPNLAAEVDDLDLGLIRAYLKEKLPKARLIEPEGTFLLWIDFSAYGIPDSELDDLIVNKAKVWLDRGTMFGIEGEGYQRINIATPQALLKEAIDRISAALED